MKVRELQGKFGTVYITGCGRGVCEGSVFFQGCMLLLMVSLLFKTIEKC